MNRILLLIASFVLALTFSTQSLASHGMGGEVSWRCLPTGEFVFTLKFYRDCNGIPAPNSLNLSSSHPTVPSIPMTRIQVTDISPAGYPSSGIGTCPSCSNPGGNPGMIEEHIYESDSIFLNGVPPANGWQFYWGECCRSSALTNITSPGSQGFRLRAIMYPFNGQNTNPCFDSSPYFIERPLNVVCSGLPVTYQHIAGDTELDSLSYEFTDPLSDNGNAIAFAPGYSVNNPLPGTNSLDPFTGEFFSNTNQGGYYAAAIKVKSYKCGVLVAENVREVHLIVINNCPAVSGGAQNQPPVMYPPFADSAGFYTLYADTVFAGDTVNFSINVLDVNLFVNGTGQMVTYNAYGSQYGDSYSDPSAGCLIPPCATLSPPTQPLVAPIAVVTNFNWITAPQHLGYSFSCVQFANTYYFLNKTADNYCPANATASRVFSITVLPTIPQPPVSNNLGVLECPWGPNYIYQWFFERNAIPGATSSSYTPVQPGAYRVLAVAPDGNGNYSEPYIYNPVGIYENSLMLSATVMPNPSSGGVFSIRFPGEAPAKLTATVTDISGRVVQSEKYHLSGTGASVNLDLGVAGKGVYLLQLESGNGFRKMERLVVQ